MSVIKPSRNFKSSLFPAIMSDEVQGFSKPLKGILAILEMAKNNVNEGLEYCTQYCIQIVHSHDLRWRLYEVCRINTQVKFYYIFQPTIKLVKTTSFKSSIFNCLFLNCAKIFHYNYVCLDPMKVLANTLA